MIALINHLTISLMSGHYHTVIPILLVYQVEKYISLTIEFCCMIYCISENRLLTKDLICLSGKNIIHFE